MGFIYKIQNTITKKCYIGETKKSNPELRWNEHKRKIEKGIGCPALQDAVKKGKPLWDPKKLEVEDIFSCISYLKVLKIE